MPCFEDSPATPSDTTSPGTSQTPEMGPVFHPPPSNVFPSSPRMPQGLWEVLEHIQLIPTLGFSTHCLSLPWLPPVLHPGLRGHLPRRPSCLTGAQVCFLWLPAQPTHPLDGSPHHHVFPLSLYCLLPTLDGETMEGPRWWSLA
jgi:hypothetical protein